jgi:hypothetical protein
MTQRVLGPTADPDMADLVLKIKQDISYNMNCVQLGTIELYDPTTNSASISINYRRQLPTGDVIDYPLLVQCPVFILSGGDSYVSMPVTSGDQCIILFNDRDIDNWYYQGVVDVPATARAHNISDGIALVGVRNLVTATPTSIGSVLIDAGSKTIAFKNDLANFKVLLDSTLDTLAGLTVQVGPTPYPLTAASIAAINAIKLQWATLIGTGTP